MTQFGTYMYQMCKYVSVTTVSEDRAHMLTHASVYAGSYFGLSQIRGIAWRINVHHLDPSMDRNIRITRQLEEVLEPYCLIFKEVKEKRNIFHHNVFVKKRKPIQSTKKLWRGGSA
jgi:hypothetical protein